MSQIVTDYWHKHYRDSRGLCSLCGNWGWIDQPSNTNHAIAERRSTNYCFCPNGQLLRKHSIPIPAPYV